MKKQKQIELLPDDKFIVTGKLYRSEKRFKIETGSYSYARSINVWNGSLWLLRDGKRTLLVRYYN